MDPHTLELKPEEMIHQALSEGHFIAKPRHDHAIFTTLVNACIHPPPVPPFLRHWHHNLQVGFWL